MLIQPSMAKILANESKKTTCMHACLCALVMLLAQKWPEYYPQSIDTLIFLIWPILLIYGSKYSMLGHNHLCLDHIMCSDMIDMFPWFLTYLDLSVLILFDIVFKNIVCMQKTLCAWVICAQTTPACSPDSTDTIISQIQPNMAIIWAHVHKKIACLHASLCTLVMLCVQKWPQCSP